MKNFPRTSTTCEVALCCRVGNALPQPKICILNGSMLVMFYRRGLKNIRTRQHAFRFLSASVVVFARYVKRALAGVGSYTELAQVIVTAVVDVKVYIPLYAR